VADDLDLLSERIRALLDAIAEGARLPRNEVEPTLTDGYARALELDAECLRLEHRIDKVTRKVADGHDVPAGKLSGLLRRLHETEERSLDLRALLVPLRELVARAA
jgi:Mg2+ and Co2+ transporter CorA